MKQSPPSRLDAWLFALDADHFAALVCALIVLGFVLAMIPSIVARCSKPERSVPSRPASSSRKAGRTSGGSW